MGSQSRRALPAAFLDRLIDQANPHRPTPPGVHAARSACGRWLALRRLRLDRTCDQIAQQSGLTVDALQLLEAGVADPQLVPPGARQRLAEVLARPDAPWLAEVVDVACGATAPPADLLGRVIDELDLVDAVPAASQQALLDELLADPIAIAAPEHEALLFADPVLFDVLGVLAKADRHTYAIWEAIGQQGGRVELTNVGVMLMQMRDHGWVAEAGQRLEPELDDEPLPYYMLTAAGRRVLEAELARRARPAGEPAADSQPSPSPLHEGN